MRTELIVSNLASTIVTHGGMGAPESGTIETLTVAEANGIFPIVHRDAEQFHFKDRDPACSEEIFRCIETNEERWIVIRGAEGTRTVSHARKFSIRQTITAEFLQRLGGGSTTEIVNAVTVCGADNTGETATSTALTNALSEGPTFLPSGVYRLDSQLNLLPGSVLISFGNAILYPDSSFSGDAVIELIDGEIPSRVENIRLDGSDLGAGTDVYGIFAETRKLEAELRNIRISGFPNSGVIASGTSWSFDRVYCDRNFGSGFELNLTASLMIGCRASGNSRYGYVGSYRDQQLGCYAFNNRITDFG